MLWYAQISFRLLDGYFFDIAAFEINLKDNLRVLGSQGGVEPTFLFNLACIKHDIAATFCHPLSKSRVTTYVQGASYVPVRQTEAVVRLL